MWWIPFTLGLAGGLHCVGMCGPLLITTPKTNDTLVDTVYGVFYHLGRILVYGFLGIIFASLGTLLFEFEVYYRSLLLIAGIALILSITPITRTSGYAFYQKITSALGSGTRYFWKRPSHISSLALGAINGLLPCGMVYAAAAGASAQTSIGDGFVFMTLFGLGTWPLLFLATTLGYRFYSNAIRRFHFLRPAMIGLTGVWLILWATVFFHHQHFNLLSPAHSQPVEAVVCKPGE